MSLVDISHHIGVIKKVPSGSELFDMSLADLSNHIELINRVLDDLTGHWLICHITSGL